MRNDLVEYLNKLGKVELQSEVVELGIAQEIEKFLDEAMAKRDKARIGMAKLTTFISDVIGDAIITKNAYGKLLATVNIFEQKLKELGVAMPNFEKATKDSAIKNLDEWRGISDRLSKINASIKI